MSDSAERRAYCTTHKTCFRYGDGCPVCLADANPPPRPIMPGHCEKHDLRYNSLGCPICVIDKFDDPPRPITKKEEAVIEAAVEIYSQAYRGREGEATFVIHEAFFRDLGEAIKALRALTAPKPVRPSEVEPGSRFRFVGLTEPKIQTTIYRLVKVRETGNAGYIADDLGGSCVFRFTDSDRIIPIQEED